MSNSTKGGIRLSYSKNPLGVRQPSISSGTTSPLMANSSIMSSSGGVALGGMVGMAGPGYSSNAISYHQSPSILMGGVSSTKNGSDYGAGGMMYHGIRGVNSGNGMSSSVSGGLSAPSASGIDERLLSIGC